MGEPPQRTMTSSTQAVGFSMKLNPLWQAMSQGRKRRGPPPKRKKATTRAAALQTRKSEANTLSDRPQRALTNNEAERDLRMGQSHAKSNQAVSRAREGRRDFLLLNAL